MRILFISLILITHCSSAQTLQRTSIETGTRTIRQSVPMTNSIRSAFQSRTRDFSGKPGPDYWQMETDYTIRVSLDPSRQTLTGTEQILVHNNSPDELKTLALRLDHNLFRPEVPRGGSTPAETTDGMVVTALKVDGTSIDLKPLVPTRGAAPVQAGVMDLNRTVATVILPTPVKAKSSVVVEIAWHTKLPGGPDGRGHRMTQRFEDRLFQPTQWFPRLAKYDDLRGWETSPYLGPAEFFNNFGKFDVYITAPAGWIVSGTGVLQNPDQVLTETARKRLATVLDSNDEVTIVSAGESGPGKSTVNGSNLTWHFHADKVNDFAWATARDFVWKATRAEIPGKGYVPIHMVYLPERAHLFERAGAITRHALEFYSKLWAPYPFPQLTLQDGPSAGMEYPMVINSNQGAADHEAAHQWWPMMVGTNETRYAWMDEGFNQYMNILSAADSKGVAYNLDGLGQRYGRSSGDEDEAPLMWSANDAGPGYRFQTYGKTPLMLSMLGGIVGDDAVIKAMKAYTVAWSFKHPSPWDYIFFMNNALGQNLEWFWYYWLWTTESVNGSIQKVGTENGKTTVSVHQAGEMPSPVVLKVEFEGSGPAIKSMPNSRMLDNNTALVSWPASVWFGGSRTFIAALDFGSRKIKKITLDPNGRFPDVSPEDNVWPR